MSGPAVIDGNYADFKLVKTRSVCQLVIEVPIERAEEAIRAFGMPQPGAEIHVAIARLIPAGETHAEHSPTDPSERGKAIYQAGSPGEQATARSALLCRDPQFQAWAQATDEAEAATFVRKTCRVNTRAAFATNRTALEQFLIMERQFKDAMRYGEGR